MRKDAVDSSKAALDVAVQAYRGNRVLIQNTALEKQPEVLMAARNPCGKPGLRFSEPKCAARSRGILHNRNVQVGETIGSGQALMSNSYLPSRSGLTPTSKNPAQRG